jgi:crossover junction endodeoxyribonuclease RuvC
MNLLALDLSLTRVGWARLERNGPDGPRITSGVFAPKGEGFERISQIVDQVEALTEFPGAPLPDLVLIEGYSFASRGRGVVSLGELGGAVRWHLYVHGVSWVEVPPAVRAKLATGKGNATKEAVLTAAVRRLGYPGSSPDEADALWILQGALHRYQEPGAVELPKGHLVTLDNVNWPKTGGVAWKR